MIDRGHELPLSCQAAVLGISRGSLYYSACPVPAAELAIMRRIDELHLDYPFAGGRMLRDLLRGEGIAIGRDQVTTMMRRMAIEAVYRRPHTSRPRSRHLPHTQRSDTLAVADRPSELSRYRQRRSGRRSWRSLPIGTKIGRPTASICSFSLDFSNMGSASGLRI
jgi:putative transposase